eukprot:TRINITY_DN3970_c0_g1_i1.p1 TRINITY_DN3970_c0_g1~~TRINITY_DN3970_c0_g1_i1.p1  ORF type:complete len:327 (+),score=39.49 TRINITY_DN3970_c0_g1_i1:24-1004(+)
MPTPKLRRNSSKKKPFETTVGANVQCSWGNEWWDATVVRIDEAKGNCEVRWKGVANEAKPGELPTNESTYPLNTLVMRNPPGEKKRKAGEPKTSVEAKRKRCSTEENSSGSEDEEEDDFDTCCTEEVVHNRKAVKPYKPTKQQDDKICPKATEAKVGLVYAPKNPGPTWYAVGRPVNTHQPAIHELTAKLVKISTNVGLYITPKDNFVVNDPLDTLSISEAGCLGFFPANNTKSLALSIDGQEKGDLIADKKIVPGAVCHLQLRTKKSSTGSTVVRCKVAVAPDEDSKPETWWEGKLPRKTKWVQLGGLACFGDQLKFLSRTTTAE